MTRALIAALFLAGCAASAQPTNAPPANPHVNVQALMPLHPLYGTLAQYDRQMKALRATLHTPEFQHAGGDIDASTAALRSDIDAAAASVSALVARKAGTYAARQDAAVSALLANADVSAPTSADVRARLQQAYEDEYTRLRSAADRDMASYQNALVVEQRRAYAAFVQSVQRHTQQAYASRAQELREKEATLLLDLARKQSAQRTVLHTKLQTLSLRPERRKQYQAQLDALQRSEERQLAGLHASNQAILSAYRGQLLTKADRDIAQTAAELQARTGANLAARRDVLAAQRAAAAGRLPVNGPAPHASPGAPASLRAEVEALRQNGRNDFRASADATLAAYRGARDDLSNRFSALRDSDSASAKATQEQIAQLQRDREALFLQIRTQIESAAYKEAERCRCTNVTAAVRRELATLP
jgi:hypothetical protein